MTLERKRILVTGSSGRVGKVLIPQLLESGYRVRALKHRSEIAKVENDGVEIIQGSLTDCESLREAVKGIAAICHLAALMPPEPSLSIYRVNIEGTFNLLEAARDQNQLERFVFASTDATYPTGWSPYRYKSPIDENQPLWPALFYGTSKVIGEVLCRQYAHLYGMPLIILRFAWVMGEGEILDLFSPEVWLDLLDPEDQKRCRGKDVVLMPLEQDGRPYCDHVVDVRDIVKGIMLALEKEEAKGEVFNIAGPAPFSYKREVERVAKALRKPCLEVHSSKVFSYEISIAKARSMLGYHPKFDAHSMMTEALEKKRR